MPIGGASVGWDETAPQDSASVSGGDDAIRSTKTSVRGGLDSEHNWPSAGGTDVGYHRLGSARAYYGPQSAVSSSGTDGRLMQTSDTSRLFHVGSGGTSYVGGALGLSVGTSAGFGFPQKHIWVEEFGIATLNSLGSATVTIPNSGYSGMPYVFQSVFTTAASGQADSAMIYNLGATAFMLVSPFASSVSGETVFWRSIGTRVL